MIAPDTISRPKTAPPRPSEDAAVVAIMRYALFTALIAGLSRTWADPDLWGHVLFGRDILAAGLARVDPYSFTSDIPWVNHEWLAEVAMNLTWRAGGSIALVLLKLSLIVVVLVFVAAALKFDGLDGPQRDLMLFAAIAGMWARVFVIRPQLFSIALFAAVLWILRSAERDRARALWLLPAVFALWVNLHGGWIVGLGVVGMWSLIEASRFGRTAVQAPFLVGIAVLGAAATLLNPYGIRMWTFLAGTVGLNRPNINDWRPLFESGSAVWLPWLMTATIAIVAFARRRRMIPASHASIVAALAVGSIRVNRLDIFFTLSVLMLVAGHIGASVPDRKTQRVALWSPRMIAAAAAVLVVAAAAGWHVRSSFMCLRLDGPWMPEREAGRFILENRLSGRMLTWFDWGEYAIWHFSPQIRVSLDGRRETVYSDAFVAAHLQLYFEPDSQQALLRRLAPDYAWLPVGVPLVTTLERLGWYREYSGPISVVLARRRGHAAPVAAATSRACFPGP
jgi:hypothetical protein